MADTTTSNQTRKGRNFPEIILDTTLAELLAEDNDGKVEEALCNFKPCADPRHRTVPLNEKYLITSTKAKDSDDIAHLQLENVSYLLSFWAGHMEVLMVACEGWTDDPTLTKEVIDQNARLGFSVLNEKQRPWPKVFANRKDYVSHYNQTNSGSTNHPIRWGFAVDFAEQVPCVIPPEKQFLLNSKRWLAECPLRSANDQIIDPQCSCLTHTTIATTTKSNSNDGKALWYHGGPACQICTTQVDKELTRLERLLTDRPAPYVLKLTQSLGSVGTLLVKSENDKPKTIDSILSTQRECLPCITEKNAHIHPASLVLSDFLPGPTHALNFFVTRSGSVKFLGSCAQLGTRTTGGGRQHTSLTFSDQDRLQRKFQDSLDVIGRYLHDSHGYFGPCGADIMINEDEPDDNNQYVIDLNVRTPTSLVLYLLKGHCTSRGFDVCVVYECLLLTLSRENLEQEFEREFVEGRLIVLGTTRLGGKDIWAYPVVLCGEDVDAVERLGDRVIEFEMGKVGGGGSDGEGEEENDAGDAGGA